MLLTRVCRSNDLLSNCDAGRDRLIHSLPKTLLAILSQFEVHDYMSLRFFVRETGCGELSGDRAGRSLVSAIDKCAF